MISSSSKIILLVCCSICQTNAQLETFYWKFLNVLRTFPFCIPIYSLKNYVTYIEMSRGNIFFYSFTQCFAKVLYICKYMHIINFVVFCSINIFLCKIFTDFWRTWRRGKSDNQTYNKWDWRVGFLNFISLYRTKHFSSHNYYLYRNHVIFAVCQS